jgi:hypothetical protein
VRTYQDFEAEVELAPRVGQALCQGMFICDDCSDDRPTPVRHYCSEDARWLTHVWDYKTGDLRTWVVCDEHLGMLTPDPEPL